MISPVLRSVALCFVIAAAGCQIGEAGDTPVDPNADASVTPSADAAVATPDAEPLPLFSFFVTSIDIMLELAGSQDGFGGDLGGLAGADAICQEAATRVGFGAKTWRAYLSTVAGPVNAVDRIGDGPWYDRNGRLLANDRAGLLNTRPDGDPQIINDLPDEHGEGLQQYGDTHDILTGTNDLGELASTNPASTCSDWTSAVGPGTELQVVGGHAWPANSGQSWQNVHAIRGCAAGVNLVQNGGGSGDCVGCSGGFGGIYCFALTP